MSNGNDLIERLEEATLQWLELRDEENAALAQEASDAIASLSEALAEAEKKGLERAAVYVEKCGDWRMEIGQQHKQDPHTGPCAQEQFWLLEAAKGIRGLTQGGSNE